MKAKILFVLFLFILISSCRRDCVDDVFFTITGISNSAIEVRDSNNFRFDGLVIGLITSTQTTKIVKNNKMPKTLMATVGTGCRIRQVFHINNPIKEFKLQTNKSYNISVQTDLTSIVTYNGNSKGKTELLEDINNFGEGSLFRLFLKEPPSKRDTFHMVMTLVDDSNKEFVVNFNNVIIAP